MVDYSLRSKYCFGEVKGPYEALALSPFKSTRDVERCTERRPYPSPGSRGYAARYGDGVPRHARVRFRSPRAPGPWLWRLTSPSVDRARAGGCAAGQPPPAREGRGAQRRERSDRSEHRRRLGRYEAPASRLTRDGPGGIEAEPNGVRRRSSELALTEGEGARRLHRRRSHPSSHERPVLSTEPLKTGTSLRVAGRGSPAPVRDMAHEESPPTVRAGDRAQARDGRPSALEQQRDPPVRVMMREGPRGPPARAGVTRERAKRAARRAS